MGHIYKITNSVDGKIYIGKTSKNYLLRWKDHIANHYTKNFYLYRAMKKYGYENFNVTLLESCNNKFLDEKEIYWINELNSLKPNGYNIAIGGQGSCKVNDKLYEISKDIKKDLIDNKLFVKDIADKYKISLSSVSAINYGNRWFDSNLQYPLRDLKKFFDVKFPKKIRKKRDYVKTDKNKHCPYCNVLIKNTSKTCLPCFSKHRFKIKPSKEEVVKVMFENNYNQSKVARIYNVSPTAVKKWCISYNIPFTKNGQLTESG